MTKKMCKDFQHDYEHYVRRGRANLRCPKCDADITLELVLMEDAKRQSDQPDIQGEE